MDDREHINDQLTQAGHAEKIRLQTEQLRFEQAHPQEAAAQKQFEKLMQIAREAKPSWHGTETPAQKNAYTNAGNMPAAISRSYRNTPPEAFSERNSGVAGGNISFVACVDDGAGGYTTKLVSAAATMADLPP